MEGFRQVHRTAQEDAGGCRGNGTTQQSAWNDCFDIIAEQVPLYPLFHRQMVTGYYADKLTDYKPIGTTGLNFIGAATQAK